MRYRLIYSLLLFFVVTMSYSQQNNTLYFMPGATQSNLLNPAFTTNCNYFGLPVLSSLHINYANTAFSYNELFPPENMPRMPDMQFLADRLHNIDLLSFQLHANLLSLGVWYEKYYFTFHITEKINTGVYFPNDLFNILWKGNTQFVGETANLSRAGSYFEHYREFALGASARLNDRLRVGVKPKLLFGKLNLNTARESVSIYTDSEKYDLDIDANYTINASLPITAESNEQDYFPNVTVNEINPAKLLLNRSNVGFATDLGGVYHYTKDITLFASLIDLGLIRWSTNPYNMTVNQSFQFEGLSESDFQSDNYLERMVDSIQGSWDYALTSDNYFTFLPAKIYAGATYRLGDHMNVGLLSRNMLFRKRIFPSLTVSWNALLFDFLSLSTSYSYGQYSFNNFGAGLSVQNKTGQFYIATDNLLAINPLYVRNVNVRFGVNFFFGCREKKVTDEDIPLRGKTNCYWLKRRLQQDRLKPKK